MSASPTLAHAPQRFLRIEGVGQQVGTELPEVVVPAQIARRDQLRHRDVEADRFELVGRDHHAHVAPRTQPPLAAAVDVPAAVHAHVRAQDEVAGEVHQEVLAGGADLRSMRPAGDPLDAVERGEHRLEQDDGLARERALQRARGAEYRVPLRHGRRASGSPSPTG